MKCYRPGTWSFFFSSVSSKKPRKKRLKFSIVKMVQNECPVMVGVGETRMETLPLPEVEPHEVLLKMSRVGLCGSDLSLLYKGVLGDQTFKPPAGLGHEASGVVYKCGSAVKHLKLGDRVALEPSNPCGQCGFCKSGKYNNCPESAFHQASGSTPPPGMLARYYKNRADFCFKLPDNVSQEEGALMEPLAVAIHTCRRSNVEIGSTILICGAGPIGLLCLITAKAMGAANVLVTDLKDGRLKVAKKLGATHTLLVGRESPEDLAKKVHQVMGCMPEITIECSGAEDSIRTGIFATRASGIMMLAGIGKAEVKIPIVNAAVREVDIKGVFRYTNCYPIAIDMVSKGLIDVKPLITHRFKFEEYKKAFDMFKNGVDGAIKCVISCD